MKSHIEFRKLTPDWKEQLSAFFKILSAEGSTFFQPHPLTDEQAEELTRYTGKDRYYILTEGDKILAYGMLRGWDEGYQVPSLGIAIHPLARGQGLGKLFMNFLHSEARLMGAQRIRLTVFTDNYKAIILYKEIGYLFHSGESGELVGFFEL